ncbi:MAG: RND transporter, partial [Rubrivivax sp.]|nr:RND transporter [Rubrivivax sp.]
MAVALALLLTGCASTAPLSSTAQLTPRPPLPAAWRAPLPHGGATVDLGRWWAQFDDALLPALIDAAQAVSPTLASARAR